MIVYSFQKKIVYDTLMKGGYYHPFDIFEKDNFLIQDKINSNGWGFFESYSWLREKMIQKNISFKNNNKNLIWSYSQWWGIERKKPDKRFSCVSSFYNEPFVMFELDIDESRLCLTDYHSWHYVLNYWYLDTEVNSENFINNSENDFYKNKPLNDILKHNQIKESWNNIFNLKECRKIFDLDEKEQSVQATFFELFTKDVKKVHFFDKKKCINIIHF